MKTQPRNYQSSDYRKQAAEFKKQHGEAKQVPPVKTETIVREWFDYSEDGDARRNQLVRDGVEARLVCPAIYGNGPKYYVEYNRLEEIKAEAAKPMYEGELAPIIERELLDQRRLEAARNREKK